MASTEKQRASGGRDSVEASPAGRAFADRQWYIVGRWQQFSGEARANLLRIAAIGAFYLIELSNYHGLRVGPLELTPSVDLPFHRTVTMLAAAWVMLALSALLAQRMRYFPAGLMYVTTLGDIVILTTLLLVADGPRSPLVVGYFLLIAATGLRFQKSLVWCTTLGSIGGYAVLCGYARYVAAADRDLTVPRYQQLILLVALALTGVTVGQIVRAARGMAEQYAARLNTREAS